MTSLSHGASCTGQTREHDVPTFFWVPTLFGVQACNLSLSSRDKRQRTKGWIVWFE